MVKGVGSLSVLVPESLHAISGAYVRVERWGAITEQA